MNTLEIRPILDFRMLIEMKDRLIKESLISDKERAALHRVLMLYGKLTLQTME